MDKDRIAGSATDFAGDAKAEAEGRVRETAGTAQNLYGQAKDAARDATDTVIGYAKDTYENSGDNLRDGSQAIARKVRENPLGAMLIAVGIGFALALLMTRPPPRSRHFGWDSRIETIKALIESRALQGWIVSDDGPLGSFTYEGRDPIQKSTFAEASKAVKGTVDPGSAR